MKIVYDIIDEIAYTSSTKEKLEILKKNANCEDLKNYLRLVYDQTARNFYISEVDNVKYGDGSLSALCLQRNYTDFEILADRLASRLISGNRARDEVSNWWRQSDAYSRTLLEWMILRDVRAGIGTSTINKAWPGLLPVMPYMRCSLPSSKSVKLDEWEWTHGVFAQTKEDAMFVNVNVVAGEISALLSRNGSSYPITVFSKFFKGCFDKAGLNHDYQYHGEMIVYEDGNPLPREKSNGVMNSILSGEGDFEANQYPVFVVWDMIPLQNARTGEVFEVQYMQRYLGLQNNINFGKHVRLVETKVVHSLEEAMEFYRSNLAKGLEGVIIKRPTAFWKNGDSKDQVKLKVEKSVELRVVGKNPGNGKHAETFGSLMMESECGQLEVSISGFTDKMRKEIHEKGDAIVGTIMEVVANGIMWNKDEPNKKPSLFLPRFKAIRGDRDTADSLERIEAIFSEI